MSMDQESFERTTGTERWLIRIGIGLACVVALWCVLFIAALFVPGQNQAKATAAEWFRSRPPSSAVASVIVPTPGPSKATADVIDPRRMVGDPNTFRGKNLVLQGKALNVQQEGDITWVNLQAVVPGRDTTESIAVVIRPKNLQILKDDCYRIYGVGAGTQEVTRTFTGAKDTVPTVNSYLQEAAPVGRGGYGCAAP
jgi:hypothetical protein